MAIDVKQIREKAGDIAVKSKENIGVLANTAAGKGKAGAERAVNGVRVTKEKLDLARLNPVFPEQIFSEDYVLPSIIHIVESDKRQENPVCAGSIGFEKKYKDMRMLTLYEANANSIGCTFSSSISNNSFYYVHPFDSTLYIDLDEYFDFLKKRRISELEQVAHCLGAKYFKITLKEEKSYFVKQSKDAKVKSKIKLPKSKENIKLSVENDSTEKQYDHFYVAAESTFSGSNEPIRPELLFYRNEQDIQNLIEMRLHGDKNAIQAKTYTFTYNSAGCIKEKEAGKIDFALKELGILGNASVASEVQKENRMVLEYRIEF